MSAQQLAPVPVVDIVDEIIAHLGAALMQSTPTDDQIIMGHVKAAHDYARLLKRRAA